MAASNGLRHVVVFAFIDERFPPRKNSKADVALLRAANLALRRKAEGYEDAFLLITTNLAGAPRQEDLDRYGIPGLSVLTVCRNWHEEARFSLNAEETNEFLDLSHEEIEVHGEPYSSSVWESIVSELKVHTASALRNWLQANHPASLAHAGSEYADLGSYWVGIEATECSFPWPFELEGFQNELPDNHRDKTVTWLNIMADAMGLHSNFRPASPALGDHQLKVLAATLCEWLRGFEASNGDAPMNIFSPCAAVCSLDISPLLLGLAMSQHMPEHSRLETFCEIYPEDHQQFGRALRFATEEVRPHLRAALSLHFGGDDALFHALMNVADSMPDQSAGEFFAALREAKRFAFPSDWICPWVFVSEGWCEEAE